METHDILRQLATAFNPIAEEAMADFLAPWKELTVKRRQVLTAPGTTERYLYVVLEGVQRACYLHHQKDVTLVFTYPHSFSGIIDSFLLQRPTIYQLEALTAGRLARISYPEFAALIAKHRSLETWLRIATTQVLAATLHRHVEPTAYTSEEKFTALMQRSPHLLNLIPHKYLASYIGIDATNFSKLVGSVRI
ncbi:MAG: cyclic nucleotide-binding domain-containing protein [Taibaiella sp.]|nr:cyclic nucleotide-binding domain-containing protein [Taibaiella sp.]